MKKQKAKHLLSRKALKRIKKRKELKEELEMIYATTRVTLDNLTKDDL